MEFEELKKDVVTYTAMEIVGKLMAYRHQQNISQRKLSELTGIAQKTISRIENGLDLPSLETVIKIADALGYELKLVQK